MAVVKYHQAISINCSQYRDTRATESHRPIPTIHKSFFFQIYKYGQFYLVHILYNLLVFFHEIQATHSNFPRSTANIKQYHYISKHVIQKDLFRVRNVEFTKSM